MLPNVIRFSLILTGQSKHETDDACADKTGNARTWRAAFYL